MRNLCIAVLFSLGGVVALTTASSAQRGDLPPKPGEAGKATIVRDSENVVASELLGSWKLSTVHSGMLGHDMDKLLKWGEQEIEFRDSTDSSKLVCDKLEAMLGTMRKAKGEEVAATLQEAMQRIYWAGEAEFRRKSTKETFPAALVVWRGNPHVLLYRSANGRDDLESFNVMLARDAKGDQDILFVEGDFNKESFRAYIRNPKAAEPKPEGK